MNNITLYVTTSLWCIIVSLLIYIYIYIHIIFCPRVYVNSVAGFTLGPLQCSAADDVALRLWRNSCVAVEAVRRGSLQTIGPEDARPLKGFFVKGIYVTVSYTQTWQHVSKFPVIHVILLLCTCCACYY